MIRRDVRPEARTEHAPYDSQTWPPVSSERAGAIVWAEGLLAQVRTCAGDGTRFMAGLSR